jgi:hypothetical protein
MICLVKGWEIPARGRGMKMLFFTDGSATGNPRLEEVFVRPEITHNQPLTKTNKGC